MFSLFKKKLLEIYSPVKGYTKKLEDINDPVFSKKMLGEGIAVKSIVGDVYAPISGKIITIYKPSNHAFCIKSDDGLEVMVHIGCDTVNIKEGLFKALKAEGDIVLVGDKIIEINYDYPNIRKLDLTTPIIILNSKDYRIKSLLDENKRIECRNAILSYEKL